MVLQKMVNTYTASDIYFIYNNNLEIKVESGVILVTKDFDTFIVLRRSTLSRDLKIVREVFNDVLLFKCLSEDMLSKITGDAQYIVFPYKASRVYTFPKEVFGELKRVAVLKLKEVCNVKDEELNKFREWYVAELRKLYPTLSDEVISNIRDYVWLILHLANIEPAILIEEMKEEVNIRMENAKKSGDPSSIKLVSELTTKGHYLLNVIDYFVSTYTPIEIPVYVANQFVLPGIPKVVNIFRNGSRVMSINVENMTVSFV